MRVIGLDPDAARSLQHALRSTSDASDRLAARGAPDLKMAGEPRLIRPLLTTRDWCSFEQHLFDLRLALIENAREIERPPSLFDRLMDGALFSSTFELASRSADKASKVGKAGRLVNTALRATPFDLFGFLGEVDVAVDGSDYEGWRGDLDRFVAGAVVVTLPAALLVGPVPHAVAKNANTAWDAGNLVFDDHQQFIERARAGVELAADHLGDAAEALTELADRSADLVETFGNDVQHRADEVALSLEDLSTLFGDLGETYRDLDTPALRPIGDAGGALLTLASDTASGAATAVAAAGSAVDTATDAIADGLSYLASWNTPW